jgi:hypothetical protein
MRVQLLDTIEGLGDPNIPKRLVWFEDDPKGNNHYDNNIGQINCCSSVNNYTGTGSSGAIRPYDVDLTGISAPASNPIWIGLRIMIHDVGGSGSALKFYMSSDGTNIHGITVDDPNVIHHNLVCVEPSDTYDGHDSDVLYVYFQTPEKQGNTPHKYGFNIVMVGKNGATDTPISIDPKIMNSG